MTFLGEELLGGLMRGVLLDVFRGRTLFFLGGLMITFVCFRGFLVVVFFWAILSGFFFFLLSFVFF